MSQDIHVGFSTRPHVCAICGKPIPVEDMVTRWLGRVAHAGCALAARRGTR